MTLLTPQTATRNATFPDLVTLLRDQQARKLDLVVPASKLRSENGVLVVAGNQFVLSEDGFDQADGRYVPTQVFDEGLADKLGIPLAYVRKLRASRPDLLDENVNGWLRGRQGGLVLDGEALIEYSDYAGDDRSFMVRLFQGGEGRDGVARSLHSNRYFRIDNLDVVTAILSGIRATGVSVEIPRCDLTDRRMYLRVTCPEVQALAPELLKNYRSPFTGERGADNPVVFAGFIVTNSETGGGAATITPSLEIQVCKNGATITKDALRAVHLGGRQDDGVVEWSQDTQQKSLQLVTAKARDAVQTFLNVEYMTTVIRGMQEKAGVPVSKPADTIKEVGKALAFDQDTIDGVLDHFIKGGDATAGGVMQAVTSFAQTVPDADSAYEIEAAGMRALELAAARR